MRVTRIGEAGAVRPRLVLGQLVRLGAAAWLVDECLVCMHAHMRPVSAAPMQAAMGEEMSMTVSCMDAAKLHGMASWCSIWQYVAGGHVHSGLT